MTELGKITRVDLHAMGPNEATDFTPWLAENLEFLGSGLGMDLELIEAEQRY